MRSVVNMDDIAVDYITVFFPTTYNFNQALVFMIYGFHILEHVLNPNTAGDSEVRKQMPSVRDFYSYAFYIWIFPLSVSQIRITSSTFKVSQS